jgi:hypothetical protein
VPSQSCECARFKVNSGLLQSLLCYDTTVCSHLRVPIVIMYFHLDYDSDVKTEIFTLCLGNFKNMEKFRKRKK